MSESNTVLEHPIETKLFYGIVYSVGLTLEYQLYISIQTPEGVMQTEVAVSEIAEKSLEDIFELGHKAAQRRILSELYGNNP